MPNWCMNQLAIKGSKKDIAAFKKKVKQGKHPFSFDKILPTPKELVKVEVPNRNEALAAKFKEKYGAPDWYTWRCNNWGTKWNITGVIGDDFNMEPRNDGLFLRFDTAWSPPIPIIKKLASMFPNLSFELAYCEPSMGFSGIYEAKGNEETDIPYDGDSPGHTKMMTQFGFSQDWEG